MSAIDRRLTNLERRLARGFGASFPDPELLMHRCERLAAAEGKSLEVWDAEREADPFFPRITPGESWPNYVARCAAAAGVSLVELQAEISEALERERAIIALESAQGLYGAANPSHDFPGPT